MSSMKRLNLNLNSINQEDADRPFGLKTLLQTLTFKVTATGGKEIITFLAEEQEGWPIHPGSRRHPHLCQLL